jgi:hypothetical protein
MSSMTSPPKTHPLCRVSASPRLLPCIHEWQTDSLAAATTANALVEGADATDASVTPTTRIGNYTQIVGKTIRVSGTLEAVDKAGRKSEKAYNMAKASAEMKRDIETIITANQGQSAGDATTARVMGSLLSYIKTNSLLTVRPLLVLILQRLVFLPVQTVRLAPLPRFF